jgi:magnesium chelatase family protein
VRVQFPCTFSLVAATNPCPCGWFGDPDRHCQCSISQRQRYWSKLSGPLLDRIDLQVVMQRLPAAQLGQSYTRPAAAQAAENSATVAQRVESARQRMLRRNPGGVNNQQLSAQQLRQGAGMSPEALRLWEKAVDQRRLSARSAHRLLRVARTIADLEGQGAVGAGAIAEALSYRSFDLPVQGL